MIAHNFVARTNLQLSTVLVFVVFSQFAIAQKVVTKNWDNGKLKTQETLDKKGFKTGECTYYYENGQLRLREFYVKGRREGTCEGWYDDGTPEFFRSYLLLNRNNGSVAGTEPVSVKHGKWVEYHWNGNKKKEEHFQEGVLIGEVRSWYEDGQLEELKTMEDKFENGRYERYYADGQVAVKGQFIKGEKDGDWMTYHPNGILAYSEVYKSDKLVDGPWRGKHPNGQDSLTGNINNGRKEGLWIEKHATGALKRKVNFSHGMPTGEYLEFYPSGARKCEGAYGELVRDLRRSRETGLWREWYENGQLMSEGTYEDGRLEGPYSEWYENGQKKFETTYRLHANFLFDREPGFLGVSTREFEDIMHGMTREWYANGQLMSEGAYDKGRKDGLWKEYYSSGQLQLEAIFDRTKISGSVTEYFENGNQRSKGFHEVAGRRKLRTGRWTTFYENGDKESEGEYMKNEKIGRWQEWYANGNLREDAFYESGYLQGPFKNYHENGGLRTEGQYKGMRKKQGLRSGIWKHYDVNGELVLTEEWANGRKL